MLERRISRRDFLLMSAGFVAAAPVIFNGCEEGAPSDSETIKEEIKSRFNIHVARSYESDYLLSDFGKYFNGIEKGTPLDLRSDELTVIKESLEKIPYAGKLAPHLVAYSGKKSSNSLVGGSFSGHDFNNFRDPGRFLPGEALTVPTVVILVNEGTPLDEVIKDFEVHPNLASEYSRSSSEDEVKRPEYRDYLEWVVIHEFAHAVNGAVDDEAFKRMDINEFGQQKYKNGGKNALLSTFAEVNGWILGEDGYWARDPVAWGEMVEGYRRAAKKTRLTAYASIADIHETFAEFFTASIITPEHLTGKERRYFSILRDGLEKDTDEFIRKVVDNPRILLS